MCNVSISNHALNSVCRRKYFSSYILDCFSFQVVHQWSNKVVNIWISLFKNQNVEVMTPGLWIWWEPSNEMSGAAQRVLNHVDSWLSTSPVVCVLTQQCLYPWWQNIASGPNTRTRAQEFLHTLLILICPVFLFQQTSMDGRCGGAEMGVTVSCRSFIHSKHNIGQPLTSMIQINALSVWTLTKAKRTLNFVNSFQKHFLSFLFFRAY